jgi:hypothetical protein
MLAPRENFDAFRSVHRLSRLRSPYRDLRERSRLWTQPHPWPVQEESLIIAIIQNRSRKEFGLRVRLPQAFAFSYLPSLERDCNAGVTYWHQPARKSLSFLVVPRPETHALRNAQDRNRNNEVSCVPLQTGKLSLPLVSGWGCYVGVGVDAFSTVSEYIPGFSDL